MTRFWPPKSKYQYAKKQTGFTLIELLIVIAVVAILAQIGFASYVTAVQKSYRYEVQQSMVELSQQLERYYSRNGDYSGSSTTASDFSTDYYTVSFSELEDDEYTISAVPISSTSQSSDSCGTLTFDYLGNKTPSTSGCWK
ncbi:type IV pilin protein [Psychromonas sp. 14N.309.X.WAT.B.A12]|uniref:type IV pilin protein n=1 Tax=unclassified Psychromonas TaxID=2614957 RepID=UPI0025B2014D|nr:type IV pilin protein [Psychromonas sp. 14N.309.X.WAT.B.A12]